MLGDIEQMLGPVLGARVASWRGSETCPPPALLAVLHDSCIRGEPWANCLAVYALEQNRARWPAVLQEMKLLRAIWTPIWHAQGCPASMADFDLTGNWTTRSRQRLSVSVGHVLDQALTAGRVPASLQTAAQTLLPGRYLESLGWQNLNILPDDVLSLLGQRSSSIDDTVPAEYRRLVTLLFHHRNEAWLLPMACVALALLGDVRADGRERNAPGTIVNMVKRVASILRTVCVHRPFQELRRSGVDRALRAYLDGRYTSVDGPNSSTRAMDVTQYIACVAAQGRLLASSPQLAATLGSWLLPELAETLEVQKLLGAALQQQNTRRSQQVDALMAQCTTLVHAVVARAQIFQQLHHVVTEARATYDGDPVPVSLPLADGSAVLEFRLVSVLQLDWEARGEAALKRSRPAFEGQVLLEYLEAQDDQGRLLPDDPFFVALYRGWYDLDSSRALIQGDSGLVASDFWSKRQGLLNAPGKVSQFCRHHLQGALKQGRPPQTLLHPDAFCAGMAYGALIILLALESGMRIHELQQIRLEGETDVINGEMSLPYFGVKPEDGTIYCVVYPKGRKRDKRSPMTHILSPHLQPYWRQMVQMHDHIWPNWHNVAPEHADELGLDAGIYLFQTDSTALLQTDMRCLARAIGFGIPLTTSAAERVSLTTHLLRYGYAHMRARLDHELTAIQAALSHQDVRMTRRYTGAAGPQPREMPASSSIQNLWGALTFRFPDET